MSGKGELQELRPPQEAVLQTEEGFRLLVEHVQDYAIFLLDPTGVVTTWNAGAERIKGYRRDEIVGRHFSRFYEPEEIHAGKCERNLEQAARYGSVTDEGFRLRKDGSRFWASVLITALRDGGGKLVGFAKITRDLTERKNAEEQRLRLAQQTAAREAAEQTIQRLARLQSLTARLAAAHLPEEVASVLVQSGTEAVDADFGIFARKGDDGAVRCVAARRGSSGAAVLESSSRELSALATRLVASDSTEWLAGEGDVARRFLELPRGMPRGAAAILPLRYGEGTIGVLSLHFADALALLPEERALLQTFVAQAGEAAARADTYVREVAARERFEAIARLAEALAPVVVTEGVARVVVDSGREAAGADICTVHLLNEGTGALDLLAERGCAPEVVEAISVITEGSPFHATLRTFESFWVESSEEYTSVLPSLAHDGEARARANAFWSVPLVVENRAIGLLGMGFYEARRFSKDDREFAATFSRHAAEALMRARRREAEQAVEARRSFLAEASAALVESLDSEASLRRVVALAVPRLADWCAVDLVTGSDPTPRRIARAHADPAKAETVRSIEKLYPTRPGEDRPIEQVLRTGRSVMYPTISRELIRRSAHDDRHAELVHALGLRSAMVVPLIARDRVLGVMSFAQAESRRTYTNDDLLFAEDLCRRCALAIDNARLYTAEQQARQRADVANRAKDEFLATISHELRTPLNAIVGWAKMLAVGGPSYAKWEHAVGTIRRNAVAMARLIEDLLDVSRIIGGKMRLEIQPVTMAKVVEMAMESIRPTAETRGVRLLPVLDDTTTPMMADPARLQQVVSNLLGNAVKFTPRGGQVRVELQRRDSAMVLRVSDTGKGIAAHFLPHVFDAFRQEEGGTTRSRGGLGLGLAISKQLVELHGGSIEASSEGEGRGATFTVTLPLDGSPRPVTPDTEAVRRFRDEARFVRPPQLRGLRVLVVDDEADVRQLVHAILDECGSVVRTASSAEEALEVLSREAADVLISDIGMPGTDGYELVRRIRALPADRGGEIPAIALTAYTRVEDRQHAEDAGFSLHVSKPVEPVELVTVVGSVASRTSY